MAEQEEGISDLEKVINILLLVFLSLKILFKVNPKNSVILFPLSLL